MLRTAVVALVSTLAVPALAHADELAGGQLHASTSLAHHDKRINIAADSLGALFGHYALSVSAAVSEHVTVTGTVERIDTVAWTAIAGVDVGFQMKGWEGSLSAPLYVNRAFSGAFLEPGIRFQRSDRDAMAKLDTYAGPMVLAGWHWTHDSGVNLAAAAGASQNLLEDDDEPDTETIHPDVMGYVRIGYAF